MVEKGRLVSIPDNITVRDLADLLEVSPIEVLKLLISSGIMANINQVIDYDTAAIVATDLGFEIRRARASQTDTGRPKIADVINLRYPLPIAKLFEAMGLEMEPRLRLFKLVELFEVTVRHVALVSLAVYDHHRLSDPKVENCRGTLEKPSLGNWVSLLITTASGLGPHHSALGALDPNQIHKNDRISGAIQVIAGILQNPTRSQKFKLSRFLGSMVELRNRKFAHGSITVPEAKRLVEPLEKALMQWLGELAVLRERQLVHIATVAWQDAVYVYSGTNLNSGAVRESLKLEGDTRISNDQVYLYDPTGGDLLPLHPYFIYDDDVRLLYVHDRVSSQGEQTLRCPYEAPSEESERRVETDLAAILGVCQVGPTREELRQSLVQQIVSVARQKQQEAAIPGDALKDRGLGEVSPVYPSDLSEESWTQFLAALLSASCAGGKPLQDLLSMLPRTDLPSIGTDWRVFTDRDAETRIGVGQVDILIESAALRIIVENKVAAPLASGQLQKYADHYDARQLRDGIPNVYLYLSPEGRRAEDPWDRWISISYSEYIAQIIDQNLSVLESQWGPTPPDFWKLFEELKASRVEGGVSAAFLPGYDDYEKVPAWLDGVDPALHETVDLWLEMLRRNYRRPANGYVGSAIAIRAKYLNDGTEKEVRLAKGMLQKAVRKVQLVEEVTLPPALGIYFHSPRDITGTPFEGYAHSYPTATAFIITRNSLNYLDQFLKFCGLPPLRPSTTP